MGLKRKFILRNLALLVGLGVLGAAALWGLAGLRSQLATAVYVYEQLATIEPAELRLAVAQAKLANEADLPAARAALDRVIADLSRFTRPLDAQGNEREMAPSSYSQQKLAAASVLARVRAVREALDRPAAATDLAAQRAELAAALDALHAVVRDCDDLVRAAQDAATRRIRATTIALAVLSSLILAGAILVSTWQYRGVMLPLTRLRRSVQNLAAGDFAARCDEKIGDREFSELAREFNRMASELDDFYRRLEQKVQQASKELVRSERLASVGFLAAGVAHEINNPLNIISGYAELTLKRLRANGEDDASLREAEQSLQVIRDEAFRCKEITGKLLSLSRGGGDGKHRQPFSLAHVAEDVAGMLGALRHYRDRRVALKLDQSEPLVVVGSADEMKQVVLNLAVNALEAVTPGVGEVQIDGRRQGNWVELCVADNGRGMPPEVLDHVFEPFFTARVGPAAPREPGTGLGLSITHAIVSNHGGQIRAESGGPGLGSRFTVRLPAATRA